ncbi:YadA-like family protein [uncultured Sneathia sp.]|uniref:YadA-like family protein n=1 Tax=uncultured Sneathia sp. TaxID=278067 RepID=UPI002598E324|nr:YadA-like family protein [uncultured Sneathia sp.]
MANLPQFQPSCGINYELSGAYGTYGKESVFAVGLSGTNKKGNLVYKLSESVNTKGNVGFGVGFAYVFGLKQNKSVCNLEYTSQNTNAVNSAIEQLKSENENIKETVQTLQNENKEMKELIKQILDIQVSSIKLFTLGGYISNKDVITKTQKKDLINIIDEINKNYIDRIIDITGYADTNGENKLNLELRYRRAKEVVELLHSLGLSKTVNIGKVSSSGMDNIVSDTNKSSNIRVEIIVR